MTGPSATSGERAGWTLVIGDEPSARAEIVTLLREGSSPAGEVREADAASVPAALADPAGPPACVVVDARGARVETLQLLASLAGPDGDPVSAIVVIGGPVDPATTRSLLRAGVHEYVDAATLTADVLVCAYVGARERSAMRRELRASEAHEHRPTQRPAESADLPDLKESDARLRLALEASRTGIWTWDLRTDVVTWSSECYAIHGLTVDEFAGTGAAFFQLVHPDDRARTENAVRAAVAGRSLYQHDFRVVRPDGAVVWAHNLGRAGYDGEGRPTRMLGTITDISQRKYIEEALRIRERELQTLADNTPDIIARFDRQLRHVYVNAAVERATGRRPAEFIGKTNRELGMADELCDRWDRALHGVFASGQAATLEFAAPARGELRYYNSRLILEASPGGAADSVLVITQDISERKQAEDALRAALARAEQAVRARDRLVSLVSHDLRNPLYAVSMGLHLLETRVLETGPPLLRRMTRQVQRMDRMIDELLDVAVLHAGEPLALDLQPTDLAALVREVTDEHTQASPRHSFAVDIPGQPLIGRWDSKRIRRVIDNLLANAIKFSPDGGPVSVELRSVDDGDDTWAALRVEDHGIGIPAADHELVFHWYARGGNTQRISGTGIGLSGARDIVHLHGGSISFVSEEGQGTTFTVRLPVRAGLAPRA